MAWIAAIAWTASSRRCAHCEPDLVLLQEVTEGSPRSHHHRQVDLLGDALDMPYRVFQPNVRLKEGRYGNAILSRHPLSDIQDLDLTVPLKKRRRALIAHCRVHTPQHTRTCCVFNVHLGLAGLSGRSSCDGCWPATCCSHTRLTTGVIVAGDYNDVWGTLGTAVVGASRFQGRPASVARRFRLCCPCVPLDRVYYRGALDVQHSFASRSELVAARRTTCRWSSISSSMGRGRRLLEFRI